jgi:hypothetical protein
VIHKLINSIWNKKELSQQWKEYIIVLIYKKGDKIHCNNDRRISLTIYKVLFSMLVSRLTPYADKIRGDHQCGLQHNRLTTDQIFCIHQILWGGIQWDSSSVGLQ